MEIGSRGAMKVIGAGLPRTATSTQMFALENTVPGDRLLVWDPREGWEPLCDFLELDAPEEPLPRLNDTLSFREGIIGGALGVINGWWEERERPTTGLHGAPLS